MSVWNEAEARSEMKETNTAKTAERVGKSETEHCKNRDSPISPSDPQASKTISAVCHQFITL